MAHLSDIEIAQQTKMEPIVKVAERLGLQEDDIELYGKYKAKISFDAWDKIKDREDGNLILVTAITPTPASEVNNCICRSRAGLPKLVKKAVLLCVNHRLVSFLA